MHKHLDRLLHRVHRDGVIQNEDTYLSKHSNVEVFEAGRKASKRQKMNDDTFISYLKDGTEFLSEETSFRAIFIPDKPHQTDKLQLSNTAFELLFERFSIFSRFAGMIQMQMCPSRKLQYDTETKKLTRLQFIYSAINRSLSAAENPKDPTKRVLDWQRFVVWTGRDMLTGATTMVILRCPPDAQERFITSMGDEAEGQRQLLRQPMLPHAFFAEDLIIRGTWFSGEWAKPIYGMEGDLGRSAAEYTSRARRFMLMARQMGNMSIDYDIYLASIKMLQEISYLIRHSDAPAHLSEDEWRSLSLEFDDLNTFEQVEREFVLLRRYGQLYEQRCQLGNSECTALVNQREIEISKSMSAESTIIARSSHRDGQSLRIIQYLGLVFLPLSLCTSIFGMGFFDTEIDPNKRSRALFFVSETWWWFIALAVPFTIVVLLVSWALAWWSTKQVDERRKSDVSDLEKVLSYEMTPHIHKTEENIAP